MALGKRKYWLAFGLGVGLGVALLAGWAWHDGGTSELRPMSAPARLPGAGQ